ncbi:glycoside hydrolase family 88/105 protein [Mangrovibacterium lignilyticum]|uniref:glycoside hydrolase family 88/105 protein n=1 Tax=Mangrovibacterium lignilyticum TaxID=2668052 RepID=UPI0013CF7F33|nr:glycoside hydrolase family 88 protein [Mangrovibacterium lignilyticum]
MKYFAYFCLLALFTACSSGKPKQNDEKDTEQVKWSIKMADAVMERSDSLGHYNGRTRRGWSYDVALLGMAIDKLGNVDPKYSAYMKADMDAMVDNDGHVARYDSTKFNIDYVNPAKNLLILWEKTGDEKYKKALGQFVRQMENHPKTKTGGYWHKKIYPWQIWLDGVYMGMPFLAEYAKDFDDPRWFDVATHEIILVHEKTLDPKTGLLYHAWDESKEQKWANPETGQSPHFWSRAMGWYVMAIVDVLDYLPEDHKDRAEIIKILQETCDALLKVRDPESGAWYQVLDQGNRKGNYLEGSGTAMYIYAFAKGARLGYLDPKYTEIAADAFDDMVATFIVTGADGLPDMVNICGSCGLGGKPTYRDGSYEYYTTEKINTNDTKGVAPFILAAIETDK